ncbi:uncharacterized membrane protein YozB (DUF420 family) [Agrobacterium larrymoorei]|uniref:Uncharacterized membrane protein YozB (DUF420 family) n=1 Tax=Agrobacterium larrymoorei TaxID=160699 RepID=A0AAJ2BBA2_9HYPH|nr:hypothetical protein [Agrobacterium larrymoorei]MDR6101872.1 uncharacterized membrane protein YozB (DUF420 family) [Agrobacterium larrymoorei]
MLFLTAAALGVCLGTMRNAASIVFVAFLIVVMFVVAAFSSPGSPSYLGLLLAILGYNAGLINVVAGMLMVSGLRVILQNQSVGPDRN